MGPLQIQNPGRMNLFVVLPMLDIHLLLYAPPLVGVRMGPLKIQNPGIYESFFVVPMFYIHLLLYALPFWMGMNGAPIYLRS